MTRHGNPVHVRSQRTGRRAFDWLERIEIIPKIRAGIEAGDSDIQIAQDCGISDRTVFRYRRAWGYVNPRSPRQEVSR
jgi:hypothetical protein